MLSPNFQPINTYPSLLGASANVILFEPSVIEYTLSSTGVGEPPTAS